MIELDKVLLIMTIMLGIALVFLVLGFRETIKEINEKDEKIWKLEIENIDLKEQIHFLERGANNE